MKQDSSSDDEDKQHQIERTNYMQNLTMFNKHETMVREDGASDSDGSELNYDSDEALQDRFYAE